MAICYWCGQKVPDKDIRLVCDMCWSWYCTDCLKALINNKNNEFENRFGIGIVKNANRKGKRSDKRNLTQRINNSSVEH